MGNDECALSRFDRVRIINLAHRSDRRAEVRKTLSDIGCKIGGAHIDFFPAALFSDAGGFPSIGARGCFDSHLKILSEAAADGIQNLLILEDDFLVPRGLRKSLSSTLAFLETTDWSMFYGGGKPEIPPNDGQLASLVEPHLGIMCSHFIALRGAAIKEAANYLAAILSRPAGSPEGGPMHVDGAYSWFRNSNPHFKTYIATPPIAIQRPSQSDVSPPRMGSLQALPVAQLARGLARRLKAKLL